MKALNWPNLFTMMTRNNAGHWHAIEGTPAEEYIDANGYRTPSRAYPYSHSKALQAGKFYKWLEVNHPEILKAL